MYVDSSRQRGPATLSEWLMGAVVLALVLGFFVAEILENYTPIKLSILLVALFWIPLLATHEFGHALAARLLGWHVVQVVIGMGRLLGRFTWGRARIELRAVPTQGFVRSRPLNLHRPRLKSALIYSAGPGMDFIMVGIVWALLGRDRLFSVVDDYGVIIGQSLALAAAAQGVMNLLPLSVASERGAVASDGLGIILSFLRSDEYYEALLHAADDVSEDE
jgi:hypothetical protein